MKSKLQLALMALGILFTTLCHAQDMQHAPTAEQCRADIAVWKQASKADQLEIPVETLLTRANYLFTCHTVLRDAKDYDGSSFATTIRDVYHQHALDKALRFIDRKGLRNQFDHEDAWGVQ